VSAQLDKINERMKKYKYDDYKDAGAALDAKLLPDAFKKAALEQLNAANTALGQDRRGEFTVSPEFFRLKTFFAEYPQSQAAAKQQFTQLRSMLEMAVKQTPESGAPKYTMDDVATQINTLNAALVKAGAPQIKLDFDVRTLPVGDPAKFAGDPRFKKLQDVLDIIGTHQLGFSKVDPITYTAGEQKAAEFALKQAAPAQNEILLSYAKDRLLSTNGNGGAVLSLGNGADARKEADELAKLMVLTNTAFTFDDKTNTFTIPNTGKEFRKRYVELEAAQTRDQLRTNLLSMAAQGMVTVEADGGHATLNMRGREYRERRDMVYDLSGRGVKYELDLNVKPEEQWVMADIKGLDGTMRKGKVVAALEIRFTTDALSQDNPAFAQQLKAAKFLGEKAELIKKAGLELPGEVAAVYDVLKAGKRALNGTETERLLKFMKDPPPAVKQAESKATTVGQAPTENPLRIALAETGLSPVIDDIKMPAGLPPRGGTHHL